MPESYAGSAIYPANITLPVGTDRRLAKSVRDPFKELANRTTYLNAQNAAARLTALEYSIGSATIVSEATNLFTTLSESYELQFSHTIAAVQVGDVVEATIGPLLAWMTAAGSGSLQLAIVDDDHVRSHAYTFTAQATNQWALGAMPIVSTMLHAGTCTISVNLRTNTGGVQANAFIMEDQMKWLHFKISRVAP